jgi:apolipoprotein N-acyltransferase
MMECLLQYLDDLDDFAGMLALAAERIRQLLKAVALMCITLCVQLFGVVLALTQPPLALAAASLLSVGLLYRAVVNHTTRPITTS